jgi:DNA-binding NarL/FixJ family response regulator
MEVRVLVVEDQGVAAEMAAAALADSMRCEVTVAVDPLEALSRMAVESFDAVVVDMLYLALSTEFEVRRRRGDVRLTDSRLHVSGLAVLHDVLQGVRRPATDTKAILWSSGEPNRRLHMTFAYEVLGCRVMCSKQAVGNLPQAVHAALADKEYIDPVLNMYFPPPFSKPLRKTILASSSKLAIWRAMALGLHQHKAIAKTANVDAATVRKGMDDMRSKLLEFDPGCAADGSPSAELIRYASQNWEFFLDDTVREMFP